MDGFMGEIRLFGFGLIPKNWAACNGAILPVAQNQALFSLLGTTYGGNGSTTYALPNLQGRAAPHTDSSGSFGLGQTGGEENHTILQGELPTHTHLVTATTETANASVLAAGNTPTTGGAGTAVYLPGSAPGNLVPLNPASVVVAGQSQSHANMQPFLVLNYCICLYGIYPSRS